MLRSCDSKRAGTVSVGVMKRCSSKDEAKNKQTGISQSKTAEDFKEMLYTKHPAEVHICFLRGNIKIQCISTVESGPGIQCRPCTRYFTSGLWKQKEQPPENSNKVLQLYSMAYLNTYQMILLFTRKLLKALN